MNGRVIDLEMFSVQVIFIHYYDLGKCVDATDEINISYVDSDIVVEW